MKLGYFQNKITEILEKRGYNNIINYNLKDNEISFKYLTKNIEFTEIYNENYNIVKIGDKFYKYNFNDIIRFVKNLIKSNKKIEEKFVKKFADYIVDYDLNVENNTIKLKYHPIEIYEGDGFRNDDNIRSVVNFNEIKEKEKIFDNMTFIFRLKREIDNYVIENNKLIAEIKEVTIELKEDELKQIENDKNQKEVKKLKENLNKAIENFKNTPINNLKKYYYASQINFFINKLKKLEASNINIDVDYEKFILNNQTIIAKINENQIYCYTKPEEINAEVIDIIAGKYYDIIDLPIEVIKRLNLKDFILKKYELDKSCVCYNDENKIEILNKFKIPYAEVNNLLYVYNNSNDFISYVNKGLAIGKKGCNIKNASNILKTKINLI